MKEKFSINADTYTLKREDGEASILGKGNKYIIPIYQRPYSWTEQQVKKFVDDIFLSYKSTEGDVEPMFIGTMQLSAKLATGERHIIDGQQRITTFAILLKVLSIRYNREITGFDWLVTEVNGGKQQEYLQELFEIDKLNTVFEPGLNRYLNNAHLIYGFIEKHIEDQDEDEPEFELEKFLDYLFTQVYFVVIETRASLSKTLQIFDAINTTGLDLNAGDIFKIRMYEYLKMRGHPDKVFEDISKLYEKIDTKNKEFKTSITDIRGILHIYQFYLIGRYGLPVVLYTYGVDLFYERLFETIFKINEWENFKGHVNEGQLELKLEEIDQFIDIRYEWAQRWRTGNYGTVQDSAMMNLWWWSRYGRYWIFVFIFLYKFKDDPKKYQHLFRYTNKLVKVYLVYSLKFQKAINNIKGTFNSEVMKSLVDESDLDSMLQILDKKLAENDRVRFENLISGDIVYSAKFKNILCRMSALLEEVPEARSEGAVLNSRKLLFGSPIDIEHIQSYHDENLQERTDIIQKWGPLINSLGNLVVLEQEFNRAIGNRESKKLEYYSKSNYRIVSDKLVKEYGDQWSKDKAEERLKSEVKKISDFLFER